jgi:hypothetical protein
MYHEPRPNAQRNAKNEQNIRIAAVQTLPNEKKRASDCGVEKPFGKESEKHEINADFITKICANVTQRLVDTIIWKCKNVDEGLDASPVEKIAPLPSQQHKVGSA